MNAAYAAKEPQLLTQIKYIIPVPHSVCFSNFLPLKDCILYESLVKSVEFSVGNVSENVSSFLIIFKKKLTSFSLKSNQGSPSTSRSRMWKERIWLLGPSQVLDLNPVSALLSEQHWCWATYLISLSFCLLISQIIYNNPVRLLYIEEEMKIVYWHKLLKASLSKQRNPSPPLIQPVEYETVLPHGGKIS